MRIAKELLRQYRKSINPPYSGNDYLTLALTVLILGTAYPAVFLLPNTFKSKQDEQLRAEGQIPAPAHLSYRLTFLYDEESGKLELKKKELTGVLPQKPQVPLDEKDYINFKLSFSPESRKAYESWVSVRRDRARVVDGKRKYEFTIDLPEKSGKTDLIATDGAKLFSEDLE